MKYTFISSIALLIALVKADDNGYCWSENDLSEKYKW